MRAMGSASVLFSVFIYNFNLLSNFVRRLLFERLAYE